VLLQEQPTRTFALGVEFKFIPEWSLLCRLMLYIVKYGGEEIILRPAFVNSVTNWGPRSNMVLKYYVWTMFE